MSCPHEVGISSAALHAIFPELYWVLSAAAGAAVICIAIWPEWKSWWCISRPRGWGIGGDLHVQPNLSCWAMNGHIGVEVGVLHILKIRFMWQATAPLRYLRFHYITLCSHVTV